MEASLRGPFGSGGEVCTCRGSRTDLGRGGGSGTRSSAAGGPEGFGWTSESRMSLGLWFPLSLELGAVTFDAGALDGKRRGRASSPHCGRLV